MADAALDRCRETVAAGGLSPHRRMPDIRQTNERFATAANKGSLTTAIRQCGLSRRPLLRLETDCRRSVSGVERQLLFEADFGDSVFRRQVHFGS